MSRRPSQPSGHAERSLPPLDELTADQQHAARDAILDAWATQPYARYISNRDRAGIGLLAMADGAIRALLDAGWTPSENH